MLSRILLFASLVAVVLSCAAAAQEPCKLPPPEADRYAGFFTPEQEIHLGDALAEHAQRTYRVIDDDINLRLQAIGDRLLAAMPAADFRFRFVFVDLPVVNAFVLPGGRIYVTRKLVAFVESEDELAGVLAHEIGHVMSRHTIQRVSEIWRRELKVTEVGDREQIYRDFHRFLEIAPRNAARYRGQRAEDSQLEAERFAIHLMSLAGYEPAAYSSLWDRFTRASERSGGWWSNLFGMSRPEARRLRVIQRAAASVPGACRAPRRVEAEEFQAWQAQVVAYSGSGRRERLHGVLSRRTLQPPLRGTLHTLRFSPNGEYLLAQDAASIFVLARHPLEFLFRIDAPDAHPAVFSADSSRIVVHNSRLRVETWDVDDAALTSVREVVVRDGCRQSVVSPDGRLLACLDAAYTLLVQEVESGQTRFERKEFAQPSLMAVLAALLRSIVGGLEDDDWEEPRDINISFSPDSRYLVASPRYSRAGAFGPVPGEPILMATETMQPVRMSAGVRRLLRGGFVFLDNERIAGLDLASPKRSGVVRFPSGEPVHQYELGGDLHPVTRGQYLALRPIVDHAAGLFDLNTGKIVSAFRNPAVDVYGDLLAMEQANGQVALVPIPGNKPSATLSLPRAHFSNLRAVALSPDMKWLALSQRDRGGVWSLETGVRTFHVRPFHGVHISDGYVFADFPKFQQTPRQLVRMTASTGISAIASGFGEDDERLRQRGRFLIARKPRRQQEPFRDITVEVQEVITRKVLWTREYPREAPGFYFSPLHETALLYWRGEERAFRDHVEANPELRARHSAMRDRRGAAYFQVVDLASGSVLAEILLDRGRDAPRLRGAMAAGDWVLLSDVQNRILIFSARNGQEVGRVFGNQFYVARDGRWLAVQNERGELLVYELPAMRQVNHFIFTSPVALARFTDDQRLLVLTGDQEVIMLDPAAAPAHLADAAP